MWTGRKRGLLKVYPHKADGLQGKLDHLNRLVQSFTATFKPGVKTDKITILCGSDESCEQVAEEVRRITDEPIYVITEQMSREEDKKVVKGWSLWFDDKVKVCVIHSDWYRTSGLLFGEYFIFFDPTSSAELFRTTIDLLMLRQTDFWTADANVNVICTDSDSLDYLEVLKTEVNNSGEAVPEWLETLISEKIKLRPPPPPKTRKRPRTIYDLEPDEHGVYYCPKYLMRIPKDNGDYSEDDEEYEVVPEDEREPSPLSLD